VIIDQIRGLHNDGRVEDLRMAINSSLTDLLTAMELLPCGDDRFLVEPTGAGRFDRVFGGQLLAQAVMGACATVPDKDIHSLHANFLQAGTPGAPLQVDVARLRDGRSIATREVKVLQEGVPLLAAITSFVKFLPQPDVAVPVPSVAPPQETPPLQALVGEASSGRHWIEHPPAVELRLQEPPSFLTGVTANTPRAHWMRLPRAVEGHGLNAALLTYASDFFLMDMVFRLHPEELGPGRANGFSLDHAIWFHRPVSFGVWHLHTQEAVALVGNRGVARGVIHDVAGKCVASVAQEVLLRMASQS